MDVVIATYGNREIWDPLGDRAAASVPGRVIRVHDDSLSTARNRGLDQVTSDFCIFLDADDELEPGYVEAMSEGTADLRAPAVAYVTDGRRAKPRVPRVVGHRHDCSAACLEQGNYLVIGSAIRTELARRVGGFQDEPIYEDWSLFLRCARAGATVETVTAAVYRAHVRGDSRNRAPKHRTKLEWHRRILSAA